MSNLTRKAIKSLYPLHVPGKDPLPDFDDYPDDRTPLEAQQHVAAGMIKCLDKHGSGFLIGEPGCIAGESEIYDPVAMVYRRVDQITEPFHVVSHAKNWKVGDRPCSCSGQKSVSSSISSNSLKWPLVCVLLATTRF